MMGAHGLAMSLLPAAVGYWVLIASGKEKDDVKKLGKWLGIAIIALSVLGTACKVYYCAMGKMGMCQSKMACPMAGKPAPMAPQG